MMRIRGKKLRRQRGQALVEYVILIAVVALAAILVLANFSDRLRDMITGITVTLGGSADSSADKNSVDIIKELDKTGVNN